MREPLIGRDREIARLCAATAASASPRAALVLGEPGIGKTRHAAAAAADAHAQGAVVALARCPPEPSIAFEPWVRAIGELARAGGERWRAELGQAAGAELSALVPELAEQTTEVGRAGASDLATAEGARYRLLNGIGAALAYAGGDAPLVVLLDDAHWCDAASAQALGHLLERAPIERLVLLVTARDRELGRGHPVSRVLADLRRTRDLTELRLTGLDADGLAALVAARVGRAITPGLAARLQARTAGNPFFAGELVRDLDERGDLRDTAALDAAPVPNAVADLVEERLARLDAVAERLLVAVAAIGPSAPVALAARAAGIDARDAERAVAQAVSERLVDELPTTRPTIAFPHALVREALLAGVDEATLARLHHVIAEALGDDPDAEPAELARHHRLAAAVTGPAPAIAACRAAAAAAAAAHDHEQAAAQLRGALALTGSDDAQMRAPLLLELGEQELLAADLRRARDAFRGAVAAARTIGDARTLACAALGFAGGDVGFGMEASDDPSTVPLLREGLDALGDDDPRLALRMTFRLTFALVYTDDDEVLPALARRAAQLDARIDDAESRLLSRFTEIVAEGGRGPDPLGWFGHVEEYFDLLGMADACDRADLRLRVLQWIAVIQYAFGRLAECDRTIERAANVAQQLGSPRFTWEVDLLRAYRLLEHGDRAGGELLLRRACATIRRLRPDVHAFVELGALLQAQWTYDGEIATSVLVLPPLCAAVPLGAVKAIAAAVTSLGSDHAVARSTLARFAAEGVESLRRADVHVPYNLCQLAFTATNIGDRVVGERLRPLLEPLRSFLIDPYPVIGFGHVVEWHIGRLELLAGRPEEAVRELRTAVERVDALDLVWLRGVTRADLARALHTRDGPGDLEEARVVVADGQLLAERLRTRWAALELARVSAQLEGREPPPLPSEPARSRPLRALGARGGRRALAALVRGQDDTALERRFAEPRRQRALLRAMVRGFQPAHAGGFNGVVAYELEPFAIEPPPEAPWRWAIEIDSRAGRARLLEPAPLDAATTFHVGLADWVRVTAGVQSALGAMAVGRCSVSGDILVGARMEAMFGAVEAG